MSAAPFAYINGVLHADSVPLDEIAAEVGTPTYVYSGLGFAAAYDRLAGALARFDPLICYALKANSNLAVVRGFAKRGAGADVVSGGELARALAAGIPPERIVFAGIGKTEAEIAQGIDAGILQFNVESEPELILIDRVARDRGRRAEIAIRINPDVDAKTHAKITTGKKGNKFGVDLDHAEATYALARSLPGVRAIAVSMHIGSQLTSLDPYRAAYGRAADLVRRLRGQGHDIRRLDLGGGIGVSYDGGPTMDLAAFAAIVGDATEGLACRLIFEPGRFLVADAGVLLARVLFVKPTDATNFLVLDAAMNDLMRPALYDAHHAILPVREPAPGAPLTAFDVVGPICESTDIFARARALPPLAAGDLVAFATAGAYGAAMSNSYNSRPLAAEVLVNGTARHVIRPRRPVETLFADERMPPWL